MSPLWHHPLFPSWHRASPPHISSLASPPSPFPRLRLLSSPPRLLSLLSTPPSSVFSSFPSTPPLLGTALFRRPLGPRLLCTSRHRSSSVPDAPLPSAPLAEREAAAGGGGAGLVPWSGKKMGAEGGRRERANAGEWREDAGEGEVTGTAPKRGGVGEGEGDGKGKKGDLGGAGEGRVLGKGEETGRRKRGGEGRRRGGGYGEKRGRMV